ncbi:MAG TPA: sulfite oxidase-like oxidoreductase [Bacillota bacterium]|nr:sulfite oxidase-like oxidoreductase [Bacillota bacterium]
MSNNVKDRIPPNQRLTEGFPVLHYGDIPDVDLGSWKLHLFGLIDQERTFNWEEFNQLPMSTFQNDIHCVTGWSKLDNYWEGVSVKDLLQGVQISPDVHYVLLHAQGGWTTNMPLEDFLSEGSLFATKHNGEALTLEHGWPVRFVVPHLYFWKSAKWLTGVEFLAKDQAGFWEKNGYHMYGSPWKEQRFAWD